ncbi:MAG: iron-containing alcohol dehydrogenase [Victivallaceae bacterium]|nr:iron-containing alcohol dehydrogenase [Victivallaceae bacterium]
MWEKAIDVHQVLELRTATRVFFGAGAVEKIEVVAAEMAAAGIKSVLVVTGHSAYRRTGAWDRVEAALNNHGVKFAIFDKVTPNPTTEQVDEAAKLGFETGAAAVIAIGGGSAIDAGKSAAILLANPGHDARELYEYRFIPAKAAPIAAINLTHGTGSETNRLAVVSILEKQYKPAIAYDCIYPTWAIDDPALTVALPPNQTRYVSVDAVNHVIEAATTKVAGPLTALLGKETVRLVAKYLPSAIADGGDITARYFLHYASMIAGVSFDNGMLHYTHALEHPLSAVKPDLAHGLGLAVLLPAVLRQIYVARPAVLADVLSPIVANLSGVPAEADAAADGVRSWLASVGIRERLGDLGLKKGDMETLTRLAFETPSLKGLLDMAPTEATPAVVRQIYEDSF